LNLDPRNKKAQNNLATAFLLNGEDGKAIQIFENSVGKAAAYNNVGFLYMSKGLYDKAQKAFEEALAVNPVFYVKAHQNLKRLSQLRNSSSP
jgi:tetratricopeptide (TPR) repeat protein